MLQRHGYGKELDTPARHRRNEPRRREARVDRGNEDALGNEVGEQVAHNHDHGRGEDVRDIGEQRLRKLIDRLEVERAQPCDSRKRDDGPIRGSPGDMGGIRLHTTAR